VSNIPKNRSDLINLIESSFNKLNLELTQMLQKIRRCGRFLVAGINGHRALPLSAYGYDAS